MAIMATSEGRVTTETSEDQTVTEVLVATETSEDHRVTEARVVTETSEGHKVTEVLVETISEARREDLREPLQMADAETGPTTKAAPTIV